jgi:hypothetical protein
MSMAVNNNLVKFQNVPHMSMKKNKIEYYYIFTIALYIPFLSILVSHIVDPDCSIKLDFVMYWNSIKITGKLHIRLKE